MEKQLKLFEKGKFGNIELKNRIIMPPMVTNYCTEDGKPTERFMAYHEARAKGGVGMITIEANYVTMAGRGFPNQAGLQKDDNIAAWKEFTDRIHACGAKVSAQLYHGGRQTSTAATGMDLEAPTAIPCPLMGGDPKELTVERIHEIVKEYGEGARRAKEAGFDAVEIHGAHGYLINEFQSPYSNKRTDEYGGSVENRERFPLEVLRSVRAAVGSEFPVSYRLSADEYVEGGLTIEDTCEFSKRLVENGASAIHCSGAVYETAQLQIPPAAEKIALNADNAAAIRKAINQAIPVFVVGRIKDLETAEQILEEGKADFIVMGRALLADPELPNKMAEGRCNEIRKCLSCNQGCIDRLFVGLPIACMINPMTGHEYEYDLSPAANKKNVLVIGGGPAGLEAARVAATKGHSVILCERNERLGGQMIDAARPPFKSEITSYIEYQVQAIKNLNVDIRCGHEITVEDIKAMNVDEVIVATGSKPLELNVPGIDLPCVVLAQKVLAGDATGNHVAVIGGGLVGCETAEYLLQQGKKVTIVEMQADIANDMGVLTKMSMLSRFNKESGLSILKNSKLKAIGEGTVTVETNGADQVIADVDTVVMAVGARADQTLENELKEAGIAYYAVGDCVKARQILQAVKEAFDVAIAL